MCPRCRVKIAICLLSVVSFPIFFPRASFCGSHFRVFVPGSRCGSIVGFASLAFSPFRSQIPFCTDFPFHLAVYSCLDNPRTCTCILDANLCEFSPRVFVSNFDLQGKEPPPTFYISDKGSSSKSNNWIALLAAKETPQKWFGVFVLEREGLLQYLKSSGPNKAAQKEEGGSRQRLRIQLCARLGGGREKRVNCQLSPAITARDELRRRLVPTVSAPTDFCHQHLQWPLFHWLRSRATVYDQIATEDQTGIRRKETKVDMERLPR